LEPTSLPLLAPWDNFYVIVGSAAAALTGLQFVVIVLGADAGIGSEGANRAFGTPTIVHFCAVLLISAMLSAPWPSVRSAAWGLGALALAGFAYTVLVFGHLRRQKDYEPVLEDWIWHTALPLAGYGALVGVTIGLVVKPEPSLFVAGAASLLLLFVGIHNAWDAVIYVAMRRRKKPEGTGDEP
jgi:hypothetical protein